MDATKFKIYFTWQSDTCLNLCQSKVCNVEKSILYEKEHMVHPYVQEKKRMYIIRHNN